MQHCLALDWHPRARTLFFQDKVAEEVRQDEASFHPDRAPANQQNKQTIGLTECLKLYTSQVPTVDFTKCFSVLVCYNLGEMYRFRQGCGNQAELFFFRLPPMNLAQAGSGGATLVFVNYRNEFGHFNFTNNYCKPGLSPRDRGLRNRPLFEVFFLSPSPVTFPLRLRYTTKNDFCLGQ